MSRPALSLNDQANTARAAAVETIAAELARWPQAEIVGEREGFDTAWYFRTLSTEPAKRIAAAEDLARQHRADADKDRARYEDIRTRGADALSDYDIALAHGGDAFAAVRSALRLKHAHITYNNTLARAFDHEANATRDNVPQLELF